jgi:peptidyl-prolyl cis-trans isomerase B (cyclophilin B)
MNGPLATRPENHVLVAHVILLRMRYAIFLSLAFLLLSGCAKKDIYSVFEDAPLNLGQAQPQQNQIPGILNGGSPQQSDLEIKEPLQQPNTPVQPEVAGIEDANNPGGNFPQKTTIPNVSRMTVSTAKGDMVIKLYPEKAPKTINNYLSKAASGFWEGLNFHRVEDWVVQGGDPLGTGTGGGQIETELSTTEFKIGSAGVARGNDITVSNEAQFFICIKDCSWLTGKYTLFGEIESGLDVAVRLSSGDVINKVIID